MTDKLPHQLLQLFQPRPPLRYIPPQDPAPEDKASSRSTIGGIADFLPALATYAATDEYHPTESWLQRKDRLKREKMERLEEMKKDGFEGYKPEEDPQIRGDAFKTLFVGRLSYDAKESDLEREFGRFGPIERIRIVKDENQKNPKKQHRGYAFIVYEREKDMKAAYKETDRVRIKDRPVLVDVERGRTVKGWKPRRFGGGLGGRGYTRQQAVRPGGIGGPPGPGFQGGGFRGGFAGRGGGGGGFRGGFRGDRGGGFADRGGGFSDRSFGSRGGIGYQGAGGFGSRGGYANGAPPLNAPSGPGGGGGGGGGRGGYGGYTNGSGAADNSDRGRNGYGDRDGYRGGGSAQGTRYDSRDARGGITGSNREPVVARDRGYGGDRDRDRDRERGDRDRYGSGRRDDDFGSRKRYHDGDGYEDPRIKRRY
ncbi:hypothetical protein GJ744_006793 [Endocarpon pusillum]|uniref:RRM domain-containing protein n=1 Tax=Endocarpon pusillum TaxID=364733 RepID=A0A8H7E5P9_9EURO|nr:hypothetical protein GJ744_006793 [Endocarpon pusillum]